MASAEQMITGDIALDETALASSGTGKPASGSASSASSASSSSSSPSDGNSNSNSLAAVLVAHEKFIRARQELSELLGGEQPPSTTASSRGQTKKPRKRKSAEQQARPASDDEGGGADEQSQVRKKTRTSTSHVVALSSQDLSQLFNPAAYQLLAPSLAPSEKEAILDVQHFLAKAMLYGPPIMRRGVPSDAAVNIRRVLQEQRSAQGRPQPDIRRSGLLNLVQVAISKLAIPAELERTQAAISAVLKMAVESGSERLLTCAAQAIGAIPVVSESDPFCRFFANHRAYLIAMVDKALESSWDLGSSRMRAFMARVTKFDPVQVFVQVLQAYRWAAIDPAQQSTAQSWRLAPFLAMVTEQLPQAPEVLAEDTYVCAWVELVRLTISAVEPTKLTPCLVEMSTALAAAALTPPRTVQPSKEEDLKQLVPLLTKLKQALEVAADLPPSVAAPGKQRRDLLRRQRALVEALGDCLATTGHLPSGFPALSTFRDGVMADNAAATFDGVAHSALSRLQKAFERLEEVAADDMVDRFRALTSAEVNCTDVVASLWGAMRVVHSDSKESAGWKELRQPRASTEASTQPAASAPAPAAAAAMGDDDGDEPMLEVASSASSGSSPEAADAGMGTASSSFFERHAQMLSLVLRGNTGVDAEWSVCTALGETVFVLLEHLRARATSDTEAVADDSLSFDGLDAAVRHVRTWFDRSADELAGLLRFARVAPEALLAPLNVRGRLLFLGKLALLQPMWKAGKLFVLAGLHRLLRIFVRRFGAHPRVLAAQGAWDALVQAHALLVNVVILEETWGCAREQKPLKRNLQTTPERRATAFDSFATSPASDLMPALGRLQVIDPGLTETAVWGKLNHSFGISNSTSESAFPEVVFPRELHSSAADTPLPIRMDRTQLVESILANVGSAVKRQLLVQSGPVVVARRLQCFFSEEGVPGPVVVVFQQIGVHREGVRLGAMALYEEAVAQKWLVATAQPGVLWSRDCAVPVDSVERYRATLILGLLAVFQVECLRRSISLPVVLSPAAYLMPSLAQQLSRRQIDMTEAEVLARIARYDGQLAERLAPLMQCSDAQLKSQELEFLTEPRRMLTKRRQLTEYFASFLDAHLRRSGLMSLFYRGVELTKLQRLLEAHPTWLQGHDERDLERCLLVPQDTRAIWAMLAFARDKKVVTYLHCTRETPVVQWFWAVVLGLETEELRQALMVFWTSVAWNAAALDTLTIELSTTHLSDGGQDRRFPTATTCVGLLQLPHYSSREHLERQLRVAILPESTHGFGNF
jgi:hypothetical protein